MRTRRTKEQIRKDNYNRDVDAYNFYVVNLDTMRAETGFEFKEDAVDLLNDYDDKKKYKVVSKRALKSMGIENPNESFKYEGGGDFQSGVYAKGGGVDYEYDAIAYAKTKGKESVNWDKELKEYAGSQYSKLTAREKEEIISDMQRDWDSSHSYAKGGGLESHGIKQGDTFLKTISGGIQQVKDKNGNIFYINLATGERSADIPLPFANGGEIRRFDRHSQMDSDTRSEIIYVIQDLEIRNPLTNYLYGLFDGYDYSKTKNFKIQMNKLRAKDFSLHKRIKEIYSKIDKYKFEKYNDFDEGGEVTYFINKDGIRVRSKVEPKEKLSEKEWMAKHNDSKEARSYAFGGFFGKSNMESKPKKINLNDKQVRLNSGEYVQVLDQDGDTLMVMELSKIGTGASPKMVKISDVDMTSFATGGSVDVKKGAIKVGVFSLEDLKTDVFEKAFNKKSKETGFTNIDLKTINRGGKTFIEFYLIPDKTDSDVKIKDWYMKNYPTDDLGEELNDEVTFEDMWNEDYKKYDIYQVMGVGDSLIRERLFEHLAEIKGVSYDVVYRKLFSTDGFYENGGKVFYKDLFNDYKNQPEELKEIVDFYETKWEKADYNYKDSFNFQKEVETIGYTFNYGLDNEPFALRKKDVKLNQVLGYENMDIKNNLIFANGGSLIGNQKRIDMNHNGKIDAEDFEIMRNTMNGAWRKERKYVNSTSRKNGKVIDYEVRYARKNNPSRKGYKGKTFATGGGLNEDVSVIYVDNYPYYIKKMDSTHFRMANSKDGVDIVIPSHILQHRGESYFEDVRSWLKGGANPNGKKYETNDSYATGGGVSNFERLSRVVAKNYEGKRVKPQYQKEYGKVYSKEEAKEVGNKVAGKVKANQKMSTGGATKKGARGGIMTLAKKIRKDGEKWTDAVKRAGQQLK